MRTRSILHEIFYHGLILLSNSYFLEGVFIMSNLVKVHEKKLEVKTFKGQRVVTFKDIDSCHQRPQGTASRNFKTNRGHFIENEDYFIVKPSDFQKDEFRPSDINNRGTTLITETGYLMLVKSFTDDLAWSVQRELVKNYFRAKEQPPQEPQPTQKLYKGIPVVTIRDIMRYTGFTKGKIHFALTDNCKFGKDYLLLEGNEMKDFKEAYPQYKKLWQLYIIFESGVKKLGKILGVKIQSVAKVPTVPIKEYSKQNLSLFDELKLKSFIMNDLELSKPLKLNYYYETLKKFGVDIQFLKNIHAEIKLQQSAMELGETIIHDLTQEEVQILIDDLKNDSNFKATSKQAQDYTLQFISKVTGLKENVLSTQ